MCSISGFIRTSSSGDIGPIAARYKQILARSAERGQDSAGVVGLDLNGHATRSVAIFPQDYAFIDEAIRPGCRVLIGNNRAEPTTEYVQDKSEADAQPFGNGRIFVSHNGTIANDHELRQEHAIQTATRIDTAVIPELVARRGVAAALSDLRGSFALAVIDSQESEKLWLARNYKPLYLQANQPLGAVFFASHPNYLRESASLNATLHESAIVSVPAYHWVELSGQTGNIDAFPITRRERNKRAYIICSGGLDSVTAAKWTQLQGYDITLLHFLYNCRAQNREVAAVKAVAQALACDYRFEDLSWLGKLGGSSLTDLSLPVTRNETSAEYAHEWVPARNLIFCSLAAALCDRYGYDTIVLGLNLEEGGAYPDNTVEFYQSLDHVCDIGTVSRPKILSPLANMVKHEIVQLALDIGAPIDLSWSCYHDGENHCGHCGPCFMRRTAFSINGVEDPIIYGTE